MENPIKRFQFMPILSLFGGWAFLRFFMTAKVRHFVFQNLDIVKIDKVLVNHGLIALEAVLLLIIFVLLRRQKVIDQFHVLGRPDQALLHGGLYGSLIFLLSIPVAFHFGMKFSPQFDHISAIGNLISNAAEELIYRGILFCAVGTIVRNSWIAVLVTSIAFGIGHWDLPSLFQFYIAAVGGFFGWVYIRYNSLVVPFIAHMTADLLLDSLFH